MPDIRELEKITGKEAGAILRRRRAFALREVLLHRTTGRLPTDSIKLSPGAAQALVRWPVLSDNEIVWLYRRRAKKLQREVAADLGCSRVWVCRMEMGLEDPDRLFEYWEV